MSEDSRKPDEPMFVESVPLLPPPKDHLDVLAKEEHLEEANHGTPIHSLFLLLILSAIASVVLREIAFRGWTATSWSVILVACTTLAMIAAIVAAVPAMIHRLRWHQWLLRLVTGTVIGVFAGLTMFVSDRSIVALALAASIGSVGLVFFGGLTCRWHLAAESHRREDRSASSGRTTPFCDRLEGVDTQANR